MLGLVAPGVFLVGVAQDVECRLGRDELIVALAVLLDDAPACTFDRRCILTAEQAQAVAQRPAFDVYVIAALAAFLPVTVGVGV